MRRATSALSAEPLLWFEFAPVALISFERKALSLTEVSLWSLARSLEIRRPLASSSPERREGAAPKSTVRPPQRRRRANLNLSRAKGGAKFKFRSEAVQKVLRSADGNKLAVDSHCSHYATVQRRRRRARVRFDPIRCNKTKL